MINKTKRCDPLHANASKRLANDYMYLSCCINTSMQLEMQRMSTCKTSVYPYIFLGSLQIDFLYGSTQFLSSSIAFSHRALNFRSSVVDWYLICSVDFRYSNVSLKPSRFQTYTICKITKPKVTLKSIVLIYHHSQYTIQIRKTKKNIYIYLQHPILGRQ